MGYRGGAEAVKDLPKILTHSVLQKHIVPDRDLQRVLGAGVVEVRFGYFGAGIGDVEKDQVARSVRRNIEQRLDLCSHVRAVSVGWIVERDIPVLCEGGERSGETGTVLAVLVGWDSVEAQREYRREHGGRDELREVESVLSVYTSLIEYRQFGETRE
jgi:hypothetical protein